MQTSYYERHFHQDPNFPVIFHQDFIDAGKNSFTLHWHENLELLFFIEGSAVITSDTLQFNVCKGELAVINSNCLHKISAPNEKCSYYCLIIDKIFLDSFSIHTDEMRFSKLITNDEIAHNFMKIATEMKSQLLHYKSSVKALAVQILVQLCRNHIASNNFSLEQNSNKQLNMVKDAINFIRHNFNSQITIDDICYDIGFSKYYFCRAFKTITGQTVIDYINFLRCENAKRLIDTGKYNVSESAEQSGFNNLSYFSKTYKKYIGILPSQKH